MKTPGHVYLILGLGSCTNHMSLAELREMWRKHGAAVTKYWLREFGQMPDCAAIAERENWNGCPKPKAKR